MSIAPYPHYKDSGVEWIGEIPTSWSVTALRRAAKLVTERSAERSNPVALENIESWTGRFIRTEGSYEGEGTAFLPGDVLFGKLRPYLAKAWLATETGEAIGDFHVLRCGDAALPAFLQRVLLSKEVISQIDGSTYGAKMPRAGWDFLASLSLPMPPRLEQAPIVAFLDRETAKIDDLIAEQERLIELLAEKQQAVISHAVTKGLDPTAPMKDSGIAWAGLIPSKWDTKPLHASYRFVKKQLGLGGDVLSVYRDFGVILKSSRDDNINKTPEDLSLYQTVHPGDLVINKMKAWQGSLGVSDLEGITSPDYAVFEPVGNIHFGYLNWLLRCKLLPDVYRSISNGIRPDQWRLEPEKFKELKIPFPPTSEQADISEHLCRLSSGQQQLAQLSETAITLLRERRSALISAAVTGKIDVRGLVADTLLMRETAE